jgi:transposase
MELSHPYEIDELKKTALLSTTLPIWQFDQYHGVSRDNDLDYTNAGRLFPVEPQKSGQKSISISPELHYLWWMDSWQEPRFDSVLPIADPAPKTYYMDAFDDQGWFTEKQWALIAPRLPPEPRKNVRGCPPTSSQTVISAIFWKTAHHVSWEELGDRFPPARTLRRYYKGWLLSGRLMTIYKVLLDDLLQRGRIQPYDFVMEGYFKITEDYRIFAPPGKCPDTWQTRLALFLMQETYALLRRIRREEKNNYFPNRSLLDTLTDHYLQTRFNMPPKE